MQSGGKRRTELVASVKPDLSYTGGLCSARTIKQARVIIGQAALAGSRG
jgi:hypothetical protein